LTRGGRLAENSGLGEKGEPQVYYPTGVRNFARTMARDDLQGWRATFSPGSSS
jgi:hypothetical protein